MGLAYFESKFKFLISNLESQRHKSRRQHPVYNSQSGTSRGKLYKLPGTHKFPQIMQQAQHLSKTTKRLPKVVILKFIVSV